MTHFISLFTHVKPFRVSFDTIRRTGTSSAVLVTWPVVSVWFRHKNVVRLKEKKSSDHMTYVTLT